MMKISDKRGTHLMISIKLKPLLIFLIGGLILSAPALARDVAMEQLSATTARKVYDEAKSNYDNVSLSVQEQEKRVAQEQARLKEQQEKQATAKERRTSAKLELDKKLKILDNAWNNKNQ
jgi:hypothetical protein